MKRRILACLLSVLMLAALVPVSAMAVDAASAVAQIGTTYYGTLKEAVSAATSGNTITILKDVSWPSSCNIAKGTTLTFEGASKTTAIDFAAVARTADSCALTFKNITLKYDSKNSAADKIGWKKVTSETYENCVIEGTIYTYGAAVFKDCTFNQSNGSYYNIWTWAAPSVSFTGCTFNCAGNSVTIYKGNGTVEYPVTFETCKFIASAAKNGVAAIQIDSRLQPYVITIRNCTATGFGKGSVSGNTLWNVKAGDAEKTKVYANSITWVVDGSTTTEAGCYPQVIAKPADPVKAGYIFDGWAGYTEGMTMPANDVTFTATWRRDPAVPVALDIAVDVTELVGGGEVALTVTSEAEDLLSAVVVTCDDASVAVTGFGGTWTATLPDATQTYTFTVQFADTVTGFGSPTASCTVAVTKLPSAPGSSVLDDYGMAVLLEKYNTTYPISVTAGVGGTVTSDTGSNAVKYKQDITYTITPDEGYAIEKVTVNGVDMGAISTYTFEKVTEAQRISATFAALYTNPFIDVADTDWFADAVRFCAENGMMTGMTDTAFKPGDATTRAQVVTVLYRLAGSPAVPSTVTFFDVAADAWYAGAVEWASANGIVLGDGQGLFTPDKNITREQLAAILVRYTSAAADAALPAGVTCSAWAADSVASAFANGYFASMGGDFTDMTADATRAEIANAIYLLCTIQAEG